MSNLFTFKFWFNMRPGLLLPLYNKAFLALLGFFLLASIALFFCHRRKSPYSRWLEQLYSFALTNFFIGSLYYFLIYEFVPFLSSRFWFLLWLALLAVWAYSLFKDYKELEEKRSRQQANDNLKRYLP